MLKAGSSYESPRNGARIDVIESSPERIVFERLYKPHTGKQDPHIHHDISQTWEVLSGTCRYSLEKDEREVPAGESVEMGTGVKHQDIHNASDGDAVVRWTVRPYNDFVTSYAEALAHMLTTGGLNDQDEFPQLQLHLILHETKAQSFDASIPVWLQGVVIPVAAQVAKARGYRARYDV